MYNKIFLVPYEFDIEKINHSFNPYLTEFLLLKPSESHDYYVNYRNNILSILSFIFNRYQINHLYDLSEIYISIFKESININRIDDCILYWCNEVNNGLINGIPVEMFNNYLNV